jgi:hypothetical protein
MANLKNTNTGTFESLIAEAVKKGINAALEEGKGKPTDKGENHDRVGKKHQKGADKKKEAKKDIRAAKKITKSQLAEGVRKALRMALKEAGMPGGAMPTPGMGAGAPASAPTQEAKHGSMTGGEVPPPEELQAALDEIGGWHMNLQGADYLAFAYALEAAGIGNPDMNSGEGMHAVLMALANAPSPDELPETVDDEEIENPHSHLNKVINSWDVRYGRSGDAIEDHAERLASDILDVLGWEWV